MNVRNDVNQIIQLDWIVIFQALLKHATLKWNPIESLAVEAKCGE